MDAGPGRPKPILFLDFEASSLSEESWPIEIGAASIVHGNVRVWSTLIAPRRDWPLDDWREASARVHGIPFEDVKGGADPERVARLTDQFTAYDVISDRYDSSTWNIYAAQASDGDNWDSDSTICRELLISKLMPLMRYYAYVEITPRQHQSLWYAYQDVKGVHPHFAMEEISGADDIYPVFRELFKRQEA